MKTHDLARALNTLSNLLRSMPNQDLEDLRFNSRQAKLDPASIPMALSTLVALARFDKAQWLQCLTRYSWKIIESLGAKSGSQKATFDRRSKIAI